MARSPRRLVFVCELGLLCAAAALSARLINGLLAEQLASVPYWPQPLASGQQASPSPRVSLSALEALFPQARATRGTPEPRSTSAATTLGQRLVGTLVANQREWSMASVQGERSDQAAVVMEGDLLEGRRVVSIERWRVLLDSGEVLALAADREGAGPGAGPAATERGAELPGIRQIAADAFRVERNWLEKALADPNAVTKGVRVVPAFEGGHAVGFRLSLRQGSVLNSLGLQSGDVVRRINGLEINSPERALEAYAALRTAYRLELELTRAGQPVRQRYQIAP